MKRFGSKDLFVDFNSNLIPNLIVLIVLKELYMNAVIMQHDNRIRLLTLLRNSGRIPPTNLFLEFQKQ